jgi:hypothetical protein
LIKGRWALDFGHTPNTGSDRKINIFEAIFGLRVSQGEHGCRFTFGDHVRDSPCITDQFGLLGIQRAIGRYAKSDCEQQEIVQWFGGVTHEQ